MYHSHSYMDPNTGEHVDVMIAEHPDDGPDYRNGRDHRGGGTGDPIGGHRTPPWRPHGLPGSRGTPGRVIVRHTQPQPGPISPRPSPGQIQDGGDYIAIPKSAAAELIPALGQVWASFLGRPDAPHAIGDDVVDRNNAAMHRDALATHAQNQTRILALTDLAARTLRLIL